MKRGGWQTATAAGASLVILLGAAGAAAEKLYSYRSENGTLSFSDRPPADGGDVAVRQAVAAEVPARFTLRRTGPKEKPTLVAVNEYHGPVEVEISLVEQANIAASPPLPARFVVPAASDLPVVTLGPREAGRDWSYRYGWRFVPGDPAAVHAGDPYLPPFPSERSFTVSQAFYGQATHTDPQNRYAVDIAMPEGTPILAARGGRVMEVAQDFFGSGTDDARYLGRANFVRILHDDGTMGIYAHLRLETSQVVPGMRVEPGDFLAESGNTGFSSGPHLHFVVQKNAGLRLVSVPFTFSDPLRGAVTPVAGLVLAGVSSSPPR